MQETDLMLSIENLRESEGAWYTRMIIDPIWDKVTLTISSSEVTALLFLNISVQRGRIFEDESATWCL